MDQKIIRWVILLVAASALLWIFIGNVASAGTLTVTFNHPTKYTDGTTLAVADIQYTTIEYGTQVGGTFGASLGYYDLAAPATSYTFNLAAGSYCVRAQTKMKSGTTSGLSNVSCKTVDAPPPPTPNPPTIVTITTTAYELRPGFFRDRIVVVGRVERGEVCGGTWKQNKSYAYLSDEQVRITRPYKGGKLLGRCG
jgi:hypothetical protein